MSIHEITDDEFTQEVLESGLPVLVEFWAPWCGPCRQLAPVLEQLAEERAGSLKVVKINQDEQPRISAEYRVMGLPTMLVFDRGAGTDGVAGPEWPMRRARYGVHGTLWHLRPQQAPVGSRPGGGVRGVGRCSGEHAAQHR